MNDFFRRNGVATLTVKELFDFAVDPAINDDNLDAALDALMEVAARCAGRGEVRLALRVWTVTFRGK